MMRLQNLIGSCWRVRLRRRRNATLLLPLLLVALIITANKLMIVLNPLLLPLVDPDAHHHSHHHHELLARGEDPHSHHFHAHVFRNLSSFPFPLPVEDASLCNGRFVGYGGEFARLRNVVIDSRRCECSRRGGEDISSVLKQDEAVEYCRASAGCFRLDDCASGSPNASADAATFYHFVGGNNHLEQWFRGLQISHEPNKRSLDSVAMTSSHPSNRVKGLTLAVKRYEYVNLYHTMTDWYNAFLLSRIYSHILRPNDDVNILLFDAHPSGSLDAVWDQLFNNVFRLSDLAADTETQFDDLMWCWTGYRSPLYVRDPGELPAPALDEFRQYFLSAYDIRPRDRVTCFSDDSHASPSISVLFIWRHDYVAHPRNPSGRVTRKIANEDELIENVRKRFPRMRIDGVQIDKLPMAEQLQMISNTDILIGMHGAGLTHAVFLTPNSTLVELTTSSYADSLHFAAIARWRQLHYLRWVHRLTGADFNAYHDSTGGDSYAIPPSIVTTLISQAVRRMCPPDAGTEIGVQFSASTETAREVISEHDAQRHNKLEKKTIRPDQKRITQLPRSLQLSPVGASSKKQISGTKKAGIIRKNSMTTVGNSTIKERHTTNRRSVRKRSRKERNKRQRT